MSKREARKLMNNSNLIDKKGVSWKNLLIFFLLYKKMDNTIYCQRNKEKILNWAKDYYENDKERLREQARSKYRNLFEEDKIKKKRIWKK